MVLTEEDIKIICNSEVELCFKYNLDKIQLALIRKNPVQFINSNIERNKRGCKPYAYSLEEIDDILRKPAKDSCKKCGCSVQHIYRLKKKFSK